MTSNYISKLIENLNYEESFKNKKIQTINIVLDSGCFNGGYLYGSLLYIKNLEKKNYIKVNKISGASVGALSGFVYILDKLELCEASYEIIREHFKNKGNLKCIQKMLIKIKKKYLEDDFYLKCNNKLYITYYNINTKQQIVRKKYKNNDDLIETLINTSYIPFLNGSNICNKGKYVDGIIPYIPKLRKKNKTLYIDLTLYKDEMFITSKQKNVYVRMINGILETHNFFLKKKKSKICNYIDDWSLKDKCLNHFRSYVALLTIYIFHIFILIYTFTPSFIFNYIKKNVFIKIIFNILKDIYIEYFLE